MRKFNKYAKILGILIPISVICCTSDSIDKNPFFTPFYGEASINLNGNLLDVAPYANTSNWNDSNFNLILARLNENLFLESQVNFTNIPRIIGKHAIINGTLEPTEGLGSIFSTYLYHGDVGGDLFRYDSTLNYSFIQLDSYNDINMEIEGTFQIQFLRSTEYISNPELPDTLNIHGTFLTIIDYE